MRLTKHNLGQLINASPRATAVVDRVGSIVKVNQRLHRLCGISARHRQLPEYFSNSGEIRRTLKHALDTNTSVPCEFVVEDNGKRLDAKVERMAETPESDGDWLLIVLSERRSVREQVKSMENRLRASVELQKRLVEQKETLRREMLGRLRHVTRLSYTDPLTRLPNRRFFDREFEREIQRVARQGCQLGLILIDVDHFKEYNDCHGHQKGDLCLRQLAKTLKNAVTRRFDQCCRVGGEEFAILLPMTDGPGTYQVAQRVLEHVRSRAIPHAASDRGIVTVSVGAGNLLVQGLACVDRFYDRVDEALYRAKSQGRDRIEFVVDQDCRKDRISCKNGTLIT